MVSLSGALLRVALLSISPHNRAILEFFFAGAGKQLFRMTSEAEADVFIVDFDHPGAEQEWNQRAELHKPGIILSVREVKIPNAIWVPKPLTSKALTTAAEQSHRLLNQAPRKEESTTAPPDSVLQTLFAAPAHNHTSQSTPSASAAQPFGLPPTVKKPRHTLVLELPDEDEAELAASTPPSLATTTPTHAETTVQPTEKLAKPTKPPRQAEPDPELIRQQEHRWALLCGEHEDVQSNRWRESDLVYTPENYFLNSLQDAVKLARQSGQPVHLKIDGKEHLFLLPTTELAYSSLSFNDEHFVQLCQTPIQPGRVQLHIPSTAEMAKLDPSWQTYIYDLEAVTWTVSLLTAHGRLGRNTNPEQRMRLNYWPNFTRLESIPHAMRIAAAWQQRAGNVFEVTQWLEIPQRYVIAFYNATMPLGLLVTDQGTSQYKEKETPKKNRGLFSRLLKRLLGGGTQ